MKATHTEEVSGFSEMSMDDKTLVNLQSFPDNKEETGAVELETVSNIDDYPDGGLQAWLVVLGAFCTCFASFGFVNSWGAFQSYYEQTLLQTSSASNIAWIGSIQYSFCFLPTIIVGRLFDLGYFKAPFSSASCVIVAATLLTAECKVYWHFLLCQGIVVGLASGVLFGPLWAVISHWFKRRRGMALGVNACGSSLGGTVFPIVFRNLVGRIGFPWTMRVIAFMLLISLNVANLTLRRRLPPVNVSGGLLNLRMFKSLPFTIYALSAFFAFLGMYTVLTYIVISASESGLDGNFAFYLLSIANASSTLGRVISGLLTDRIGAVNVMAPFSLVAGIMTFIWPFVHGKSEYVVIAVLYGISSGAYVSLLGAPMIALGEVGDVGRRTGLYMNVLAIGALLGPPISGAINEATDGYSAVGFYAGTMVIISVCAMWTTKCLVLGQAWGKF
ncbi:hypothetical protein M0805_006175 [Coniferiporia weirii]|nr:hypothetical protein M0805_006175 [Coniferiporia weirii]